MIGSQLAANVLEFCDLLASRYPDVRPKILDAMVRRAKQAWEGAFAAMHAPIAIRTWETEILLPGGAIESGISPLEFPQAVEIVGFYPTIVPVSYLPQGALVIPTTDDLVVQIAYDSERRLTKRAQADLLPTTTGTANEFVTASSVSVLAPRLFGLRIESTNPQLDITWRWKQGVGVFVDSICSMAAFCRYI